MAQFALKELGELLMPTLFFVIILSVILTFNANYYESELRTSETHTLSQILPKESRIEIEIGKEFEIIEDSNNNYAISIEDANYNSKLKTIKEGVKLEKQGTSIIIKQNE